MTVDVDKMRKFHESQQKGGDFLAFDIGDTLVYVHPGCRSEEDEFEPTTGMNFIPVVVHYGVGKGAMVVSLDPETNPILKHPFIRANLKKKKVRLTGECPMKDALADGTIEGEDADNQRPQTRYLYGMTPLKYRRKASMEWSEMDQKPSTAFVGKQIFDGIMACVFDNGDISDPKAAYLIRITREGKDRTTKYSVKAEPEFLKKPFVMPKALAAKVAKSMVDGGDCDLFRIVSNFIKPPDEVKALLAGVAVSREPDDEGEEEDDEAELPKPKKKAKASPPDEDEEEEEEAPPPPKKKVAKAPPPEEEEEEEAPPSPKKKAKTPPPEEEEEEETPPPPKKKAKAPPAEEEEEEETPKPVKKKAKAPPPDEEDDELELSELEEALENLEEEEEETPKPVKKKAKAPPPDEDEEEEDDEEEPPPPPKKKVAKK